MACALCLMGNTTDETNLETFYQIKKILTFIVSPEKKPGFVCARENDVEQRDFLIAQAQKTRDCFLQNLVTFTSRNDSRKLTIAVVYGMDPITQDISWWIS